MQLRARAEGRLVGPREGRVVSARPECRALRRRVAQRRVPRAAKPGRNLSPKAIPSGGAEVVVQVAAERTIAEVTAIALGYACILGSVFRCIPQVHRIFTRKSVEGISFVATLSEFLVYTVNVAYNLRHGYAFNTFGDLVISWLALIFILTLLQRFREPSRLVSVAVPLACASWCAWLLGGVVPMRLLTWLQAGSSVMLALGSRIPQIALNVRRGGTGEVSIVMYIANVLGCAVRFFTTATLTKDTLLLLSAAAHGVLNAAIVVQCVDTRLKWRRANLVAEHGAPTAEAT